MLRLPVLLLSAAVALGFAPLPFPKPPKPPPAHSPLDDLMGDWQDVANKSVALNITPTEFAYVNSGRRDNVYKLTLDVSRIPYRYDIRQGRAEFVGIWKIEGDKLTVQYVSERKDIPDGGRPTAFGMAGNREIYARKAPGGWRNP